MSKPVLYLFNGKVGSFGNAVFGFTPAEVYSVTLDTVSHGSISASPMSGVAGTTIELSNTPDTGYQLGSYSVDGSVIVGSSFSMPDHNVVVGATFSEVVYSITVGTSLNGTVTASSQSASAGTTVTLSSTPDSGYELDYYTVNGVAILGNTFTMPAENVTVGAVFKAQANEFLFVKIAKSRSAYRLTFNEISSPEWQEAKTSSNSDMSGSTDIAIGSDAKMYTMLKYPLSTSSITFPRIRTEAITVYYYVASSMSTASSYFASENNSGTGRFVSSITLNVPAH